MTTRDPVNGKGQGLRVGLMVPANNTTMEHELPAWLPPGSGCTTLRIRRGPGTLTLADIPAYVTQAIDIAESIVAESLDVVVYGCTAAGILAGPRRDAQIAAALVQVTGKPTVTTAQSMVACLEHLDVRSIALLTPYLEPVNERLEQFLASAGITVRSMRSFNAATVDELAAIDAAAVKRYARETMRDGCEALFIACSQLPTAEIIAPLEEELGCPVWSSIRATAWQACRAVASERQGKAGALKLQTNTDERR